MLLFDTNKEKYHLFTSMSSWLSGEERGLLSEGAQVKIKEEAERFRRTEGQGVILPKFPKNFFCIFIGLYIHFGCIEHDDNDYMHL